jgi:hypothetical protein
MPLLQDIRSLFARREPRKVTLEGIGEFHEERRYGWWTGGVWLAARKDFVGVCFETGGQPPGEREARFWRRVADQWPELWQAILSDLRRGLFFHSAADAEEYFAGIRPNAFGFDDLTPGDERWEIEVQPDYSEHLMTLRMRGLKYQSNRLDG